MILHCFTHPEVYFPSLAVRGWLRKRGVNSQFLRELFNLMENIVFFPLGKTNRWEFMFGDIITYIICYPGRISNWWAGWGIAKMPECVLMWKCCETKLLFALVTLVGDKHYLSQLSSQELGLTDGVRLWTLPCSFPGFFWITQFNNSSTI